MKLLVVRNDRLGDFILAWPALALLRAAGLEPWVLVPPYTRPLAELCPSVTGIVESPPQETMTRLARRLRAQRFDALLTLFSTGRTAGAALLAGIPYRLAPATKLFQLLYNHRELQRRSRSEKPEWHYNLDLAARLLRDFGLPPPPPPQPPFLTFPPTLIAPLREALIERFAAGRAERLVMVHPGSGGSARSLAPAQWAALIDAVEPARPTLFLVNAGPSERARALAVAEQVRRHPVAVLGGLDLPALARHIACCDLFIAGSTGPLHLAGALDVPTAGLYPRHRSATPLRWQTLNSEGRRIAFTPPAEAAPDAVGAIDPIATGAAIGRFLG